MRLQKQGMSSFEEQLPKIIKSKGNPILTDKIATFKSMYLNGTFYAKWVSGKNEITARKCLFAINDEKEITREIQSRN